MNHLVTVVLKLPRDTPISPEAAHLFLSALLDINKLKFHQKLLLKRPQPLALEIVLKNQEIFFQITGHADLIDFVEGQVQAAYPLVTIEEEASVSLAEDIEVARFILKSGNFYPIRTYGSFREVDSLASVLSVLARAAATDFLMIQYALKTVSASWQVRAETYASEGTKRADGTYLPRPDQPVVREKIKHPGFAVSVRVATNRTQLFSSIAHAFNTFTRPDGNQLVLKHPLPFRRAALRRQANSRTVSRGQILTTEELATLWHLPSEKVKTPSIAWGSAVLSDPPIHLPIITNSDAAQEINFFARTHFKNRETTFGIKDADRGRHLWAIGMTGTGKSSLIATMAMDDLRKGKGLAVIDPHGDLCEKLLDYIPKHRINDVIYFDPSDQQYPIILNPLEVKHPEQTELVVSGLISIFKKLFGTSWGPRLEYILRNALFTLAELPNATLKDIPLLLTNPQFRDKAVARLRDKMLKAFWLDEFDLMPPNLQRESVSPILNKVGQFVTSPLVRSVIGQPTSSIDLERVMNDGKILLANLSQGKIGEDNAQMLGAMLITKFQLAAMQRVKFREEERRDFFLYVDEFQNFATDSFVKILSEARKYHLSLMLANQYVGQISPDVQKAILGNVGTLISFGVGAEDARRLSQEFAGVFSENDLINLANRQIALKLMIDGHAQRPFLATTLPVTPAANHNRAKVIRVSRERWGKRHTQKPKQKRSPQTQIAGSPAKKGAGGDTS